uniref:Uncharacterized protein n=1 Tax=Alectorobius mimon TaxID=360319 RepID=A0A147B7H5_9ACAR
MPRRFIEGMHGTGMRGYRCLLATLRRLLGRSWRPTAPQGMCCFSYNVAFRDFNFLMVGLSR